MKVIPDRERKITRSLSVGDVIECRDGSGMPNGLHRVLHRGSGKGFKPVRILALREELAAVTPVHWDNPEIRHKEMFDDKVYPSLTWIWDKNRRSISENGFWISLAVSNAVPIPPEESEAMGYTAEQKDLFIQNLIPTKAELQNWIEEAYLGSAYPAFKDIPNTVDDLWSWIYNTVARNMFQACQKTECQYHHWSYADKCVGGGHGGFFPPKDCPRVQKGDPQC